MAPKASTGKEKGINGDGEEILQAVVLADGFNNRFKPLTINKPRCLLPVCNVTLLDWTFESLALAGVQEIFVICRSCPEQVKVAIKESKWSHPISGIKIVPIVTAEAVISPGDAMRDIYTHGVIQSDFILVHGDLVSSIRIDEVVRAHKERRKSNKDAIMTIVVKEAGAMHRTRPKGETSLFVLDAKTQECMYYEAEQGYPPQEHLNVPSAVLNRHPELDIRNDLIDCNIDICSVEVPSLFQDNFDYQDIRHDFVHGVLTSDLLMKNIYCHVVTNGYAARVKDTKSYAAVSRDILGRWSFPLTPDNNYPSSSTTAYEHERGNKYLSIISPPQLARTSFVGRFTQLGPGTSIAADAQVSGSVLGANCFIGYGSIVKDSILWDSVRVEPGCCIEGSVLGKGVTVLRDSRVAPGCLIGDGVVIGPGVRLEKMTRISLKRGVNDFHGEEPEDEDSLAAVEHAQTGEYYAMLGGESNAMIWPEDLDEVEDEDDEDGFDERTNERLLRLGYNTSDFTVSSDSGSDSSSDQETERSTENVGALDLDTNLNSSLASLDRLGMQTTSVAELADAQAIRAFQVEVADSLARAFYEKHSVENAAVELKTLRMASNMPLRRVREAVIAGIVNYIPLAEGMKQQTKEIEQVISRWGELIDRIGGVDAIETIEVLQEHCAQSTRIHLFGPILAELYRHDFVEEDDIRAWHARPASKGAGRNEENIRRCWAVGSRMITQLDEQEEESE